MPRRPPPPDHNHWPFGVPEDRKRWPIGRVHPDDPAENTRDHERLWWAIDRLKRKKAEPAGFVHSVPSLELAYLTPGHLEAWWRLGDAGPWPTTWPNPLVHFADSSGNGRPLTAVNSNHAGSGVLLSPGDPQLPTLQIPGAYTGGDPDINDGGVKFNYEFADTLVNGGQLSLLGGVDLAEDQDFAGAAMPVGGGYTLSVFLGYVPVGGGSNIFISNGNGSSSLTAWIGISDTGVLSWNTSTGGGGPIWTNSASLIAGKWYHLAVTVKRLGTTSYQRRILLNLNEVYNVTGTAAAIALAARTTNTIGIGGFKGGDGRAYSAPGMADELSLWSKALSNAELFNVFNAAVASGDTWTSGTIDAGDISGSFLPGMVPVSDGTLGGVAWDYPMTFYQNGV